MRNGDEADLSSVSSNWREEDSFPVVSGGYGRGMDVVLTETRDWAETRGHGRRVKSEGSSPEMVLGGRVFDKGTAGSANIRLDRRGDVFALPGAEDGKGEGLCPHSDRRRRVVNEVLKVNFCHGREMGIVLSSTDERGGARFHLVEEGGGRLGLSKVDGKAIEVEERLLEGVDVVLVVDVRVQLCGPFERGGRGPRGGKVDQWKGDAVEVESGGKELVEFLDGEGAIERSGMGVLRGHCGLGERDAHQHHLGLQWTLSTPGLTLCVQVVNMSIPNAPAQTSIPTSNSKFRPRDLPPAPFFPRPVLKTISLVCHEHEERVALCCPDTAGHLQDGQRVGSAGTRLESGQRGGLLCSCLLLLSCRM